MSARDDYPAGDSVSAKGIWMGRTEYMRAMAEIDELRAKVCDCPAHNDGWPPTRDVVIRSLQSNLVNEKQISKLAFARQRAWQAMAEDLWDELMAWHTDDCPFLDTPIGTPDDRCICHRDIAAKWDVIT